MYLDNSYYYRRANSYPTYRSNRESINTLIGKMEKHIHIALIEPSTLIREGLLSVFRMMKSNLQTSSFDSINQLIEFQKKSSFNLVIVSSTITIHDIEKIRNIRNNDGQTKWIGCIAGNFHRDFFVLMDNIIYVNDSVTKIQGIIKDSLLSYNNSKNKLFENKLSKREIDVIKLLAKGNANKEIADKLYISIHTVVTHRKNISQKLGIKSTAAMTIYAVANNIIDINDSLKSMK